MASQELLHRPESSVLHRSAGKSEMKPAFVVVMSSGRTPQTRGKTDVRSSAPPRTKTRKRVRVSELTRKYRSNASGNDESMLVSDTSPPLLHEDPLPLNESAHSRPPHTPSPSSAPPKSLDITAPNVIASARVAAAAAAAAAAQSSAYPVRFSRFPGSWSEVVAQVTSAVSCAVMEGHDRVRVDVKAPELIADSWSVTNTHHYEQTRQARRIELLVESANSILKEVFVQTTDPQNPYSFLFTATRAAIFFNSEEDEKAGRRYISTNIPTIVDTYVLGRDSTKKIKANVSIVIAPSNKQGNPGHIEAVELVHYSNWNHRKLVIMLNPDLFALTRSSPLADEPRQPSFLSDYVPSYYMDPAAFPSKSATGAILRCFPRKWEMYLLKMHSDMGFRLVAEHLTPPSPEKIHCEFSWRIERELEQGLRA